VCPFLSCWWDQLAGWCGSIKSASVWDTVAILLAGFLPTLTVMPPLSLGTHQAKNKVVEKSSLEKFEGAVTAFHLDKIKHQIVVMQEEEVL
jgi:hypothetical protein